MGISLFQWRRVVKASANKPRATILSKAIKLYLVHTMSLQTPLLSLGWSPVPFAILIAKWQIHQNARDSFIHSTVQVYACSVRVLLFSSRSRLVYACDESVFPS